MLVTVVRGPIPFGMKYHHSGAQLDMPERLARIYIKAGAVVATEEQPKRRRVYRRRDARPEQTVVMTAEPPAE